MDLKIQTDPLPRSRREEKNYLPCAGPDDRSVKNADRCRAILPLMPPALAFLALEIQRPEENENGLSETECPSLPTCRCAC